MAAQLFTWVLEVRTPVVRLESNVLSPLLHLPSFGFSCPASARVAEVPHIQLCGPVAGTRGSVPAERGLYELDCSPCLSPPAFYAEVTTNLLRSRQTGFSPEIVLCSQTPTAILLGVLSHNASLLHFIHYCH